MGNTEFPLFLMLVGILAILASGVALQEVLKQAFFREEKPNMLSLAVSFLGLCGGLIALMSAALRIFGLPWPGVLSFAVLFIGGFGGLVWWRLNAELTGDAPPPF
jgi:hypothetical protein